MEAPPNLEQSNAATSALSPADVLELVQRDKEQRDFLENAALPMHWVGEDGTILWANGAELRFLGYSAEEYIGQSIAKFHADEPVISDILRRLKSNEKLEGYEARLLCKDGSIRYGSINSSVYWVTGRFVHTRCVTIDVTEHKKSFEIHQRLSAIVESSDDAIISKDLKGFIQSWNPAAERIFGYKAEEIIGKHVSTLAIPERVDEIPNILERLIRGERVDHYETKRKTKDGRVLTISLTVSPIRDASGTIIGASKVARDITERSRQEEALREANTALTRANEDLRQFAYSASHDLQEPLRMVTTYSELLKREFGSKLGETGDEYIGYAIQGALRMERLLNDLRAYTLVSIAAPDSMVEIEADESLDKALATLDAAIKENNAAIRRTELPRVRIIPVQLEQLFQNLVANAIRYRRAEIPPQIHISCERRGKEFLFSVRDNGIGIDPQYQEQIFELFKRLHSAAQYPGTGLGLAICQRIVQRAGGRIWVGSELGRGSTFFFTLPVRGV